MVSKFMVSLLVILISFFVKTALMLNAGNSVLWPLEDQNIPEGACSRTPLGIVCPPSPAPMISWFLRLWSVVLFG